VHNTHLRFVFVGNYRYKDPVAASSAWVGLAPPGHAGSWQREMKVTNDFFRVCKRIFLFSFVFILWINLSPIGLMVKANPTS